MAKYHSREEYLASEFPGELEKYNLKKAWTTRYTENEVWECKFGLKAGYFKCVKLVKLEYLSSSLAVVVLDNWQVHRHEADSGSQLQLQLQLQLQARSTCGPPSRRR